MQMMLSTANQRSLCLEFDELKNETLSISIYSEHLNINIFFSNIFCQANRLIEHNVNNKTQNKSIKFKIRNKKLRKVNCLSDKKKSIKYLVNKLKMKKIIIKFKHPLAKDKLQLKNLFWKRKKNRSLNRKIPIICCQKRREKIKNKFYHIS